MIVQVHILNHSISQLKAYNSSHCTSLTLPLKTSRCTPAHYPPEFTTSRQSSSHPLSLKESHLSSFDYLTKISSLSPICNESSPPEISSVSEQCNILELKKPKYHMFSAASLYPCSITVSAIFTYLSEIP